jgi:hypothetical protein
MISRGTVYFLCEILKLYEQRPGGRKINFYWSKTKKIGDVRTFGDAFSYYGGIET